MYIYIYIDIQSHASFCRNFHKYLQLRPHPSLPPSPLIIPPIQLQDLSGVGVGVWGGDSVFAKQICI